VKWFAAIEKKYAGARERRVRPRQKTQQSFRRSTMHRSNPLLIATLIASTALAACADETASPGSSGEAPAKQSRSAVQLAAVTTVPPAQSPTGEVWRGGLSWQAPAHWVAIDASGRPYVAGEYQLPNHSDEAPSGCLISNGQKPKGKTPAELRVRAEKDAKHTDLKSTEGKSVISAIRISEATRGNFEWVEGAVEGNYVDDGTFINRRDPALIVEDYAARTAVPLSAGPPFSIRCWATTSTMKNESKAIDQWLSTFAIAPL